MDTELTKEQKDKIDKLLAEMIEGEALKKRIIDDLLELNKGEVGSYYVIEKGDVFSKSGKTYKLMMYDSFKNRIVCYVSDNEKEINKYIIDNAENLLARGKNEKLNIISTKS